MSGHSHSHGHSHGGSASAAGEHSSRLVITFVLVAVFFVVELSAAIASGSLSLTGDAGHMASDVIALGAALVAVKLAPRRDKEGRRTFGNYRLEVFASGLAAVLMIAVAIFIFVEAVERIGKPVDPASGMMMAVGILGLVINVISMLLLRQGSSESLNIKGAYLEVLSDALGSVGVVLAGILVSLTHNPWWDTSIAIAIAIFVAVRAVILGREVIQVLAQAAPADIEPAKIQKAMEELPGMTEVHDLHVWQLTSGMPVLSAHIVTSDPGTMLAAQHLLQEEFGISHVTLQTDSENLAECAKALW